MGSKTAKEFIQAKREEQQVASGAEERSSPAGRTSSQPAAGGGSHASRCHGEGRGSCRVSPEPPTRGWPALVPARGHSLARDPDPQCRSPKRWTQALAVLASDSHPTSLSPDGALGFRGGLRQSVTPRLKCKRKHGFENKASLGFRCSAETKAARTHMMREKDTHVVYECATEGPLVCERISGGYPPGDQREHSSRKAAP